MTKNSRRTAKTVPAGVARYFGFIRDKSASPATFTRAVFAMNLLENTCKTVIYKITVRKYKRKKQEGSRDGERRRFY